MKYNYKIKPVELDDIVRYDTEKYNSNNHWEHGIIPDDYSKVLSHSETSKWIDKFKKYKKITIDNTTYIKWLKEAHETCSQTGKFSNLFSDEFEQMTQDLTNRYIDIFNGTKYFIRVCNVSLKYGQHKTGPYTNIRQILESVVSTTHNHSPIKKNTDKLEIYLIDWVEIDQKYEFRIFVFNNKITCISQQNIYSLLFNEHKNNPPEFERMIKEKLDITVSYFYEHIINKINWIKSYTYDFAIIDNKPYFIEMNSFGKEYAAGSALFHWILDSEILYNNFTDQKNKFIEFRYII